MAEKNLEVKNLRISFRTNNGKVQAVRDISFDLERGRTLAIVGESGSGKSVTSRAIMGILAGNGIVEGGEILYDGKDLLKIGEEDMYKIRGDKIAMIFQDPLSSLNPIVKIGKQITEAMLLKNKASRKESRKEFNSMLELLQKNMVAATKDEAAARKLNETFNKFCVEANRLENDYNNSQNKAQDLVSDIDSVLFRASKNQKLEAKSTLKDYAARLKEVKEPFFTHKFTAELAEITAKLSQAIQSARGDKLSQEGVEVLTALRNLLEKMNGQARPDFFRIGFYSLEHPGEDLHTRDVDQLNEEALTYMNGHFMNEFLAMEEKAVEYSHGVSYKKKQVKPP